MSKIIVCGGRDFKDAAFLNRALKELQQTVTITHVIEGGAFGADRLGKLWAEQNNIPVTTVMAKWDIHGRKAGYLRNLEMAEMKPDFVIAFPGGVGTQIMIDISLKKGIETFTAYPEDE